MFYVVLATRADDRCTEADLLSVLDWHWLRLSGEMQVVICEWGDPLPGRRSIAAFCKERDAQANVVSVPSEISDRHQSPGIWGEYCAKNVALRLVEQLAADEHLVIATNLDCYFSEELCAALRELRPDPSVLYRTPRYTYHAAGDPPSVRDPWPAPLWSRLGIGKWGGEAAGDFTGMRLDAWRSLGWYGESPHRQGHLDSEMTDRALSVGAMRLVDLGHPVFHRAHENQWSKAPSSQGEPLAAVGERGLRRYKMRETFRRIWRIEP